MWKNTSSIAHLFIPVPVFVISVLFLSVSSAEGDPLSNFIKNARIHASILIQSTERKEFKVGSEKYRVLGLLGKCTSQVYLVEDTQGKQWVLKEDKSLPRQARAYYQIAATQFYLEHGVIVPHFHSIEIEPERILIVVEYFEGLLSKESGPLIDKIPNLQIREAIAAKREKSLQKMQQIFGSTDLGFKQSHFQVWLEKNRERLHEMFPVLRDFYFAIQTQPINRGAWMRLSEIGDVFDSNLLLKFDCQDWLLFDP